VLTLGSRGWRNIPAPAGWTWELPFSIQDDGSSFRVDPAFDLQTHAAISVTKTYYVDQSTGDDGNTGADWDNALATLSAAQGKVDVDRIYVRNSYFYRNQRVNWPARSMEIIGVGDNVTITSDGSNQIGAWSPADSHYEATVVQYAGSVYDDANLDAFGDPTPLVAKASVAEVDAAAGSYYLNWGTKTIYVRTFDDRAPDSDLKFFDSIALYGVLDNVTVYVENVTIRHHLQLTNASATGGLKIYLKDCTLGYVTVKGATECIMQNCTVRNNQLGDGTNYDDLNGIVTKAAEIDVISFNHGIDTTNQASTGHDGSLVVCINGLYHDVSGQCVADASATTERWMLGSELYNSASGVGFYTQGKAWLDRVHSHDNANYDLQNSVGSTIYIRNCTLEKGVNSIDGTLSTY